MLGTAWGEVRISSSGNSRIKEIRALRQRKERERTRTYFAEGIRIVREAIELGAPIEQCVVSPDLLKGEIARQTVVMIEGRGVSCLEVTGEVFRSISGKEHPQGIGAVIRQCWHALGEVRPDDGLCWIALEAVADPGNLGAILRTSDAVGGAGVILLGPATDPHDPAAVRASMGAIFAQRLVRSTVEELAAWKQQWNCHVVGTSDSASTDYVTPQYRPPLLLFMGSERQGLTADHAALCDLMVRIPMAGRSDSLNLAVATGVMLYQIYNQNR